jgi:hypothetical protein
VVSLNGEARGPIAAQSLYSWRRCPKKLVGSWSYLRVEAGPERAQARGGGQMTAPYGVAPLPRRA